MQQLCSCAVTRLHRYGTLHVGPPPTQLELHVSSGRLALFGAYTLPKALHRVFVATVDWI